MSEICPFIIYNASAGSGKTYTLVKDYLKILFQSHNPTAFKSILALTFTNKAVAEMKDRVLKTLQEFSDPAILVNPNTMFNSLVEDLHIEPSSLHQKSKLILERIVHNYASFDISTIDKFNHRLIRTFAYDLKLPVNFEVELDTISLLSKAVDKLIDKAGTDVELTKILVDFAIEKADEDKSWDLTYDFNSIAKLLINENDIPYITTIKDKTLDDFKKLKSHLLKAALILEGEITSIGKNTLDLLVDQGLQFNDFSASYLPKYFEKLSQADFNVKYDLDWQTKLLNQEALYPKRVSAASSSTIDAIQLQLIAHFEESKEKVSKKKFYDNVLKNITPLSVLNAIYTSLVELKEEDNLLLISEFNSLISNEINAQPAPYIYERIGEKFKHFFIDEFQDTSFLQWQNLIPLVDNALSGENLKGEVGTAMIVGDAKQAIYRWRGGKAEQFIDLYTCYNPFQVKKCIKDLPVNYRSFQQIVTFNNSFFTYLADLSFSNESHQKIYQLSNQEISKKETGYVELTFLDTDEESIDKNEIYGQHVHQNILNVLENGYELKDICVITRKTKEGIAIAEYLSMHNLPVISSDSLLLKNSPEINFINSIVALVNQPANNQAKIVALSYLAEHLLQLKDKHVFFEALIVFDANELFQKLQQYGYHLDFTEFIQMPLYEAIETIVRVFKLNHVSNAYLQFYMDVIFEYTQNNNASFSGFLKYWEIKKESLSVLSSQGTNAVQIMTIHKSKGLEFPIVIFPYANQDIYFDRTPKTWFGVEESEYQGFSHLFMSLNKDFEYYGEQGLRVYEQHRAELELDAINLLYVVLTRAVEQLYIISEKAKVLKPNEKPKFYSQLFTHYLQSTNTWSDSQTIYKFGDPNRKSTSKTTIGTLAQTRFISTPKEDHNLNIVTNSGFLWDTAQEKALEKGNLVHDIMSHIKTIEDINYVMNDYLISGKINDHQLEELTSIVNHIVTHENLKSYFEGNLLIYNEKDILTKDGNILRPDRVVINKNNEAVIIDYKTGFEKPKHRSQLIAYQHILEEMDIKIIKKILIYINEDIQIKEF